MVDVKRPRKGLVIGVGIVGVLAAGGILASPSLIQWYEDEVAYLVNERTAPFMSNGEASNPDEYHPMVEAFFTEQDKVVREAVEEGTVVGAYSMPWQLTGADEGTASFSPGFRLDYETGVDSQDGARKVLRAYEELGYVLVNDTSAADFAFDFLKREEPDLTLQYESGDETVEDEYVAKVAELSLAHHRKFLSGEVDYDSLAIAYCVPDVSKAEYYGLNPTVEESVGDYDVDCLSNSMVLFSGHFDEPSGTSVEVGYSMLDVPLNQLPKYDGFMSSYTQSQMDSFYAAKTSSLEVFCSVEPNFLMGGWVTVDGVTYCSGVEPVNVDG